MGNSKGKENLGIKLNFLIELNEVRIKEGRSGKHNKKNRKFEKQDEKEDLENIIIKKKTKIGE